MSKAILQCDFCGLDQRKVPLMVAGPAGADICSNCVELATQVIAERRAQEAGVAADSDDRLRVYSGEEPAA